MEYCEMDEKENVVGIHICEDEQSQFISFHDGLWFLDYHSDSPSVIKFCPFCGKKLDDVKK